MKNHLASRALTKYLGGLLLIGLLLFVPAGTFAYWNAWLFIAILFAPMLLLGLVLLRKSPELLRKRLSTNEKETGQKRAVALSALMFVSGFIVAALDFRFGWSQAPLWVVIAASAVFLIAYALYAEVLRENAYLSRVVEVQAGQKVIDSGLYGIVRHPMYFATVPLFLSMPLVLGSFWALLPFLIYPLVLIGRIRGEETLLKRELPGYEEYMRKVRYRLIPYIW